MMTIRELAGKLGFSKSSVAYALSGGGHVSEATRKKVLAGAKRFGYRPNPVASAFLRQVRSGHGTAGKGAIAYVCDMNSADELQKTRSYLQEIYQGAIDRIEELGYRFDPILLGREPLSKERLDQVLLARGIQGILLGPITHSQLGRYELDLEHFAVVTSGHSVQGNHIPRLTHNFLDSFQQIFHRAKNAGRERIGLVMHESQNNRVHNHLLCGFLGEQARLPAALRIPVFSVPEHQPLNPEKLRGWVRRHRPGVVIAGFPNAAVEILKAGPRVPEDFFIAVLDVNPGSASSGAWAGIDQCYAECGRAAADLLISRMRDNAIGLPKICPIVMLAGCWVPGKSFPQKEAPLGSGNES
jgi:LacI family transcriptional regulator